MTPSQSANRESSFAGVRASLPLVLGYVPAAMAFGAASRQAGLSVGETVLTSLVIYAGASQFALIGLVAASAPLAATVSTSLLLNVRHVLYGPTVATRLPKLRRPTAAVLAFALTDEVFALTSMLGKDRSFSARWMLALEAVTYGSWLGGTFIGVVAGDQFLTEFPSLRDAVGFALPALFISLIVPPLMVPSRDATPTTRWRTWVAVAVASAVGIGLHVAGMGGWTVLIAGVVGPLTGELAGQFAISRNAE